MVNNTASLSASSSDAIHQREAGSAHPDIVALAWSLGALQEGVTLLAQQAGLISDKGERTKTHLHTASIVDNANIDQSALSRWLTTLTQQLGCDLQSVDWQFGDIDQLVRRSAPAVLRIPHHRESRFLLLLKGGRRVALLAPNQQRVYVSAVTLVTFLQDQASGSLGQSVEQLLVNMGIEATRIPKAKTVLIAEQMHDQHFEGCWLLQVAASSSIWHHLRHNRLPRYFVLLISLTLTQQLLALVSWLYIGESLFQGGFTQLGLRVWALLLLTGIPLGLFANWAQINITLNLGRFARTRLLRGILNLNPSDVRHLGAGQFLERVMQTESLQGLILSGGFGVLNALLQIVIAAIVLRLGVGGDLHSALLLFWTLVALGVSTWYGRRFIHWRHTYRALTNDLVERMVAHRTRLAQEEKATWHAEEDQQLDHYHERSRRLDNLQRLLDTFLNRGWFLVGLAGIAIPFLNGANEPAYFALSIGGILLASQAFATLRAAVITLTNIYATWQDVRPIYRAADQPRAPGTLPTTPGVIASRGAIQGNSTTNQSAMSRQSLGEDTKEDAGEGRLAQSSTLDDSDNLEKSNFSGRSNQLSEKPLLAMRHLQFRYHTDAPLALNNVSLTIHPGDRLLLEGPSGGGKSTLANMLIGLQQPNHGLLLLHGLDQPTVGLTNWRRHVVAAPQFHENHVLTESFGFNLLMGRRWPPSPADLREAEAICQELGLGDLLARMPSGMMQMVGEGGWQLSHGERSRLYIARALLQGAALIVLDESFAALDPPNLERAITCVLKRAPSLLVIAHP